MPKLKKHKQLNNTEDLLRKILISQLAIARVRQDDIAKIMEMSKGDINAIAKFIKLPKK